MSVFGCRRSSVSPFDPVGDGMRSVAEPTAQLSRRTSTIAMLSADESFDRGLGRWRLPFAPAVVPPLSKLGEVVSDIGPPWAHRRSIEHALRGAASLFPTSFVAS